MAEDYWTRPHPKAPIRDTAYSITSPVPPPQQPAKVVTIEKVVEAPPVQQVKLSPPLVQWPTAPEGTYYTLIGTDYEESVCGNSTRQLQIVPYYELKPMYLWVSPKPDVYIESYQVGYKQYCENGIDTAIFQSLIPWETGWCTIGNTIRFRIRNTTREEYMTSIVILALAKKDD